MARILVLGGGFGGISAAITARDGLAKEHDVTLIDDRGSFMMGLSKLWALDGRRRIDAGRRPLRALERHGVHVIQAQVDRIDLDARTVHAAGKDHPWDFLVVALGARLAPEATPGFSEAAHDLYSAEGVTAFAKDLERFEGGRLLIAVCAMPFKCPPAPYEAAMIAHEVLRNRGVRENVHLSLSTPEPKPLPIAPAECSSDLLGHLKERAIDYLPAHKPDRFDKATGLVRYENGHEERFDLLAAVPVHKAPRVVVEAGLAPPDGWIHVDAGTLATKHDGVWAVGDVNTVATPVGKPLPKAGVFAEAQGRVVAHNITRRIAGEAPDARFDGQGHCFIETGDGRATAIRGDFFAEPAPLLELRPPDEAALEEKKRFERDRLEAWFGA